MSRLAWTLAITAAAIFMVTLDNLVVTTALPVLREDLGASLADLEWTVNAYTLSFAVLLLTGAALGDRFGRRRSWPRVSASSRPPPQGPPWLRRSRRSSPPARSRASGPPWLPPSP
jgi:hypothetical protein